MHDSCTQPPYASQIRAAASIVSEGKVAVPVDDFLKDGHVRPAPTATLGQLLAGILLQAGEISLAYQAMKNPNTPDAPPPEKANAWIVDPGFLRLDGHHANSNRYYVHQLRRLGFSPVVLRNVRSVDLTPRCPDDGSGVFHVSPYIWPFGRSPDSAQMQLCNDLFHEEFSTVLGEHQPSVIIAHTLRFTLIEGFMRYVADRFENSSTRVVAGIIEPDVLQESHPLYTAAKCVYQRALSHLTPSLRKRLLFVTERPETRLFLESNCKNELQFIEAPYVGATLASPAAANSNTPRKKITAGFVGQPRAERGAEIILKIVEKTVHKAKRLRWAVQLDRRAVSQFKDETAEALYSQLKKSDRVDFYPGSLSIEKYHELLSGIDIMVFPYGERYRTSGSGICMESLRTGHVQVVPSESSLESLITGSGGMAVTTPEIDVDSVASAVLKAVEHFEELSEVNHRVARQLVDEDPVARSLAAFLENEQSA